MFDKYIVSGLRMPTSIHLAAPLSGRFVYSIEQALLLDVDPNEWYAGNETRSPRNLEFHNCLIIRFSLKLGTPFYIFVIVNFRWRPKLMEHQRQRREESRLAISSSQSMGLRWKGSSTHWSMMLSTLPRLETRSHGSSRVQPIQSRNPKIRLINFN